MIAISLAELPSSGMGRGAKLILRGPAEMICNPLNILIDYGRYLLKYSVWIPCTSAIYTLSFD